MTVSVHLISFNTRLEHTWLKQMFSSLLFHFVHAGRGRITIYCLINPLPETFHRDLNPMIPVPRCPRLAHFELNWIQVIQLCRVRQNLRLVSRFFRKCRWLVFPQGGHYDYLDVNHLMALPIPRFPWEQCKCNALKQSHVIQQFIVLTVFYPSDISFIRHVPLFHTSYSIYITLHFELLIQCPFIFAYSLFSLSLTAPLDRRSFICNSFIIDEDDRLPLHLLEWANSTAFGISLSPLNAFVWTLMLCSDTRFNIFWHSPREHI